MAGKSRFQARVISLKKDSARRQLVKENLAHFGVPWRFFDALDAEGPCSYAADAVAQLNRFGRRLTSGEIGCFKSHIAAISEFDFDPELDWLLILEDDVWIDVGFDFGELVDFMSERRIGYLRLYCRRWKPSDVVGYLGERQIIRFRTDPYGAQAYLINRKASSAIRSVIRSIDMPIDDFYGRFWEHGVDIFALFPFPVIERALPSTLLSERAKLVAKFTLRRRLNKLLDFLAKKLCNLRFMLLGRSPSGRLEQRRRLPDEVVVSAPSQREASHRSRSSAPNLPPRAPGQKRA